MAVHNVAQMKERAAANASPLTAADRLPQKRYTIRCKDEKFGLSKTSGNPMVTRTWEIVEPTQVKSGDKTVEIAGVEIIQYLTLKVMDDEEKSAKAYLRFCREQAKLGLPEEGWDDENPNLKDEFSAIGKVADAVLNSKESTRQEQDENGKPTGRNIINPNTGKPDVFYQPNVVEVYGLAADQSAGSNAAF